MRKWLNRHLAKEDIQMANKLMKRYSVLLVREMEKKHSEVPPYTHKNGYSWRMGVKKDR